MTRGQKVVMFITIIAAVIAVPLGIKSFNDQFPQAEAKPVNTSEPIATVNLPHCSPADYGHGVYLFPCHGKEFASALSLFVEKYGEEVVSVAVTRRNTHNDYSDGSVVITRKK